MWIQIDPHDVLMFRGSFPFAAGASFVARSSFPPHPQVIVGAIRTAYLEQKNVDFRAYRNRAVDPDILAKIGGPATKQHPADLGNLRVRGPFICQITSTDIQPLYPMPHDVLYAEDEGVVVTLKVSRQLGDKIKTVKPFATWQPTKIPPQPRDYDFDSATGWLTATGLKHYLADEPVPSDEMIAPEAVSVAESHMGLGMDHARRTADEDRRLLYRAEFTRVVDEPEEGYRVGLLVEIPDGLLKDKGFLTLGGERRFAAYQKVSFATESLSVTDSGRIKIVPLTPAYFSGGWQPANGDWSPWVGNQARLISVSAGSPTIISGWDMARKRPKPLYRYMPAGSVYTFEDADIPQIPFTESPAELDAGAMGFGTVAIGTWDYLD